MHISTQTIMEDRHIKEILYNLTQRPEWKTFVEYKKNRLNECHIALEYESDPKRLQGQIEEIRKDIELIKELKDFLNY